MKKIACLISACYLVFSCKPPSYSYVPPTVNTGAYSHAGEGQLGVLFGSPGIGAKGGVAITPNISLNAWASTLPSGDKGDYGSKESELSIGFQTNPNKNLEVTSFYLGISNGSNEKNKTGLSGHFNRSFLQIQQSMLNIPIGSARLDGLFGLQVNYLDYTGTKNSTPFNDNLWYYQPYFGVNIGGKNVRVEIIQGAAIKNSGEWSHGVRVFPWFGHVGLLVKLGKIQ